MSRDLPRRPSLEHLKKQAKLLLRQLKQHDPAARLTAAQHALALEYGFVSWRELKTHIQNIAAQESHAPSTAFAFGRYTSKARLALFFSRDEAGKTGSAFIDPEHVLLGSIRAGRGLKGRIFERVHISLDAAREKVSGMVRAGESLPYSVEIPFSETTKKVLLAAAGEADGMGHGSIGIAHLLLGIINCKRSTARSLLTDWGMTAPRVRKDLAQLLNEET